MWLRMLALVFGVTVYAASTVLASFMAGLALGSFVAGRLAGASARAARRVRRRRIAASASAPCDAGPARRHQAVWVSVHPSLPAIAGVLTAVRFVVAFAGADRADDADGRDAAARHASRRWPATDRVGSRIGLLYAINTAGAIVGALDRGLLLLSEVGVARSFQIAAATNILIGDRRDRGAASRCRAQPTRRQPAPRPERTLGRRVGTARRLRSPAARRAVDLLPVRRDVARAGDRLVPHARDLAAADGVCVHDHAGGGSGRHRARQRDRGAAAAAAARTGCRCSPSIQARSARRGAVVQRAGADAAGASTSAAPWSNGSASTPISAPLIVVEPDGDAADDAAARASRFRSDCRSGPATERRDQPQRIGMFYSLNVCGAIAGSVLGGFVLLPLLGSRGSLIAIAALATGLEHPAGALAVAEGRIRRWPSRWPSSRPVAVRDGARCNAVDPFDIAFERFHRRESCLA